MDGEPMQAEAATADRGDHEAAPPEAEWAVVEIMGHRRHAGLIREVERFGAKMLEVREYGSEDAQPWRTHFYSGGSIFSITPCTEGYARKDRDDAWRWDRERRELPKLALAAPDGDDPGCEHDAFDEDGRCLDCDELVGAPLDIPPPPDTDGEARADG